MKDPPGATHSFTVNGEEGTLTCISVSRVREFMSSGSPEGQCQCLEYRKPVD